MENKQKSISLEIIRFLVIGVVATIFDAGTRLLVSYLLNGKIVDWLKDGISIMLGFCVGVVVNYIFSIIWVFQNVKDKNAAKTQKKFWLFVLLGFIGLVIHEVLNFVAGKLFMLASIDISQGSSMVLETIKDGTWAFFSSINFWMWALIFVLGTVIVLIWNYLSRKKWIFIAPKENEENEQQEQ